MNHCVLPLASGTVSSACACEPRGSAAEEGALEEVSPKDREDKHKQHAHQQHIHHWRDRRDQRIHHQLQPFISRNDAQGSQGPDSTEGFECTKGRGRDTCDSEAEVEERGDHHYEVKDIPSITEIRLSSLDGAEAETHCDYLKNCLKKEEKSEDTVHYKEVAAKTGVRVIKWVVNSDGDAAPYYKHKHCVLEALINSFEFLVFADSPLAILEHPCCPLFIILKDPSLLSISIRFEERAPIPS